MSKKQIFALCRVAFYALLFFALLLVPVSFFEQHSFCIYYNLFGIRCIGCGTTRAVASLLHGNLEAALAYNKLAVYVYLPIFSAIFLQDTYCTVRRLFDKSYTKSSIIDTFFGFVKKS